MSQHRGEMAVAGIGREDQYLVTLLEQDRGTHRWFLQIEGPELDVLLPLASISAIETWVGKANKVDVDMGRKIELGTVGCVLSEASVRMNWSDNARLSIIIASNGCFLEVRLDERGSRKVLGAIVDALTDYHRDNIGQ